MRRLEAGTLVRVRRPRPLRGVTATVLRQVSGGYEVGFFSAQGRPLHAVVHPRWLRTLVPSSGPREGRLREGAPMPGRRA